MGTGRQPSGCAPSLCKTKSGCAPSGATPPPSHALSYFLRCCASACSNASQHASKLAQITNYHLQVMLRNYSPECSYIPRPAFLRQEQWKPQEGESRCVETLVTVLVELQLYAMLQRLRPRPARPVPGSRGAGVHRAGPGERGGGSTAGGRSRRARGRPSHSCR